MKHWEKFFEFEIKNDCFDLQEDGLYIWDILRTEVYVDFIWDNYQDQRPKHRKWELTIRQLRRIASLIRFFFLKRRPNLFYINSRDKMPDGRFYDRNAFDFLRRMAGESHIIENFEDRHCVYLYPISLFNVANLYKRFHYFFRRRRDYSELSKKLKAGLDVDYDSRRINKIVGYFKGERAFYRWLFRKNGIDRLYVCFDMPKALYCAARDSGVKSIEFQHGIIDKGHIHYNYPTEMRDRKRVYLPDMLLTFSEFWCKDIYYPVREIFPVGNTSLAELAMTGKPFDPKNRVIGFISSSVFGHRMADLAIEYMQLNPEDHILFKLHPNQFSRRKEYFKLFQDHPNIKVITNQQPTEQVVASCDAIVLIQSTVAYEALQAGIPVFIYKRMTYYRHDHIFDSPNVRLIDNAQQILLTGRPAQPGPRDIFFDNFDERVYEQTTGH